MLFTCIVKSGFFIYIPLKDAVSFKDKGAVQDAASCKN